MRIEVEGRSDEHIIGNNTRNNYRRTFDNNRKAIVMEDLIKREDAIKVIEETPFIRRPILPHYIKAKINKIPSAEPQQGEWIFKEITDDYHITGQCSVCKERRRIDNFCPNCGARMKGAD